MIFSSKAQRNTDAGRVTLRGENQGNFSMVDEDTPSIFITRSGVFTGKAEDMDPNDKPFILTIMITPATTEPLICKMIYPSKSLTLEVQLESVDTDHPEFSFSIDKMEWKKHGDSANTSYSLFVSSDPEVLGNMFFSFRSDLPLDFQPDSQV